MDTMFNPMPRNPLAEAIRFLASQGVTVTPADIIPGLFDLTGTTSARDITTNQLFGIAHGKGWQPQA